ncbi:MAG: hypothetical protein K6C08_13960 [Oscillospiraceae bacterium]|nr:hypothetical protein [Oscillospiraceae bacterium]
MKKTVRVLALLLLAVLLLTGCGKEKDGGSEEGEDAVREPQIVEVKITGANFYDYFDYKEYQAFATDEDGNITACNLSYGFSLKPGYQAANDPEHRDTLKVSFRATGVSQYGEFDVNFITMQYPGTVYSEEHEEVQETLTFWPQGNRTVSYPYGTISSSYVILLQNFTVTAVSGSIWLLIR